MANKWKKYLYLTSIISTFVPYQSMAADNINAIHLRSQNRVAKLYQSSKKVDSKEAQTKSINIGIPMTKTMPKYISNSDKKAPASAPKEDDVQKITDELDTILNKDHDYDEPHNTAEREKRNQNCIALCGDGYSYSHLGYKNGGKEKICIKYPLPCKEQCNTDWKTNYLVQNSDYTCKEAIQIEEKFPFVGPLNTQITLTEFIDFHCGYCKQFAPNFIQLIKDNPDVKFVFKPVFFLGSIEIAKAFIATSQQGKTKESYLAFMNAPRAMSPEQINRIIKKLGLNVAKTRSIMESEKTLDLLNQIKKDYNTYGMRGVPGIVLNNEKLHINYFEDIQKAINQKRGK